VSSIESINGKADFDVSRDKKSHVQEKKQNGISDLKEFSSGG